jgi:hypothetical protein
MIRLWPRHHLFQTDLDELIESLRKTPGSCDEVWFCTAWGFPSLDTHRVHADRIVTASQRLRELGISAGLQIANTLGHGASPLFPEEGADWPLLTGAKGETEFPTPCPRSIEIHRYTDQVSRIYAAVGPSSVWIDDDLRMNNHGSIRHGCFCASCLRDFSGEIGRAFSREELVAELHAPVAGDLRSRWTRFNGVSLGMIAQTIARAFHEISPDTRLAYQQLEHENCLDSGPDWNSIYDVLANESGHTTGARLGSGFYTDHAPRQMIRKSFWMARQISRLAKSVEQICPEVENFTHNRYGKSPHGTVVESSLYLAMGCNSLSYSILCSDHEPASYHQILLEKIGSYRPFWESYLRASGSSVPAGVEVVLGGDHVRRVVGASEEPFAWARIDLDRIYQMAALGIPFCASPRGATTSILHAEAVEGLSDAELKSLLGRGVMMNGTAAFRVQERGFGQLLGVRVSRIPRVDVYERVSSDPLNGLFAGKNWMLWLDSGSQAYRLEPLNDSVRSLGDYISPSGENAGIATSLAENDEGGRVAIFGYFDWVSDPSSARRNQYLAAADWTSRVRLPVIIHTEAQVMVVPRVDDLGRLVSVFLLNVSIERLPSLELEFRGALSETCRWITPEANCVELQSRERLGAILCQTPPLAPWSCAFIEFYSA